MSVLLTAPARIALMLQDAHKSIKVAHSTWQDVVDENDRPGWLVTVGTGEYFEEGQSSEGLDAFLETFACELFGLPFGNGLEAEYEHQTREIIDQTVAYFRRHGQLQMGNELQRQPAPLHPLSGILWTRFTREAVTLYGLDDSRKFWGCRLSLTVRGRAKVSPVIIAKHTQE